MFNDRGYFDAFLIFSKSNGKTSLIFENVLDKIDHMLEDIQILCYPEWRNIENEDYFQFFFVIEDTIYDNIRRYAFCTQWRNKFNNNLEVYCLVSQNNWMKEFHGLCSILHSQRIIENTGNISQNDLRNLNQFVERFSRTTFPESGKEGIFFFRGSNPHLEIRLSFTRPYFNHSMFRKHSLLTLCKSCDSSHILTLFAAALKEKTIAIVGQDYRAIFECIGSIQSLMEPFKWQFSQIPILPKTYEKKAFSSKTPSILGVNSSSPLLPQLRRRNDVLIWDLQKKTMEGGGVDINHLFPRRVLENMYVKLQKILPKPGTTEFNSENVSELFMKFIVDIFVTYRNYLKKSGNSYVFDRVGFLKDNPQNNKIFLMEFFDCQSFKKFIEERIRMKREGIFKMCTFEERCSRIIPTLYGISLYGKTNPVKKVVKNDAGSQRKGSKKGGGFLGLGKTGFGGLGKVGKGLFKRGGDNKGGGGSVQHPSHMQHVPASNPMGNSANSNYVLRPYNPSSNPTGPSGGGSSGSGSGAMLSKHPMDKGGGDEQLMRPRRSTLFGESLAVESPQTEYSKKLRRLDKSFSVLHEEATPDQILEGTLLDLPKEEVMFPSEISSRTELFNEVIQRQEKRIAQLLDFSFDDSNQEEEKKKEENENDELKDLYHQLSSLNKEF